jgi:hypothetical protein
MKHAMAAPMRPMMMARAETGKGFWVML